LVPFFGSSLFCAVYSHLGVRFCQKMTGVPGQFNYFDSRHRGPWQAELMLTERGGDRRVFFRSGITGIQTEEHGSWAIEVLYASYELVVDFNWQGSRAEQLVHHVFRKPRGGIEAPWIGTCGYREMVFRPPIRLVAPPPRILEIEDADSETPAASSVATSAATSVASLVASSVATSAATAPARMMTSDEFRLLDVDELLRLELFGWNQPDQGTEGTTQAKNVK
jgi:hypothetical protein